MKNAQTSTLPWNPDVAWRRLNVLLYAGFGLSVASLLLMAWLAHEYLLFVPLLLTGLLLLPWLLKDELVLLCTILLGFTVVAGYEEGFQPEEALYGAAYLSYLAYWFLTRTLIYRDRYVFTKSDVALLLFLVYFSVFTGLTFVFRGDAVAMVSEWLSLSMLAFYFPIKELIARDPRAPRAILGTFGLLTLIIAIRNLFEYVYGIGTAEQWWQITSGRAVTNEQMIMMAAIGSFVLLQFAKTSVQRVILFALFGIFTAGVVISLSRAVWLSLALGLLVVFLLVDQRRRAGIIVLVVVSTAVLAGVSVVLFGDQLLLVAVGLVDRLVSLETAFTEDISLINRFIEMKAALSAFAVSPIIGYGFGVSFEYYSLVYEATRETTFVHNGYVGLLYRHGLVGTCLILTAYVGSGVRGARLFLTSHAAPVSRILGLIAVACLAAMALVASSNNPFTVSDKTLIIAAAAALAAGAAERERLSEQASN